MQTDRLTSKNSHNRLVALLAALTVSLNPILIAQPSNNIKSSSIDANSVEIVFAGRGGRQHTDDNNREIDPGPEVKVIFQKMYSVYFELKVLSYLILIIKAKRTITYCKLYCLKILRINKDRSDTFSQTVFIAIDTI